MDLNNKLYVKTCIGKIYVELEWLEFMVDLKCEN